MSNASTTVWIIKSLNNVKFWQRLNFHYHVPFGLFILLYFANCSIIDPKDYITSIICTIILILSAYSSPVGMLRLRWILEIDIYCPSILQCPAMTVSVAIRTDMRYCYYIFNYIKTNFNNFWISYFGLMSRVLLKTMKKIWWFIKCLQFYSSKITDVCTCI